MTQPSVYNKPLEISSDNLELAVLEVSKRLRDIEPTSNWGEITENELWYELVACILGSRVAFEHAQAAAHFLKIEGLIDITKCLNDSTQYELDIVNALIRPIYPSLVRSRGRQKYRYPNIRANHIRRTAELIYKAGSTIKTVLYLSRGSREAREKIMSTAIGIGPKQASLFLCNTGYANDLAILDRHVLRYMFSQDLMKSIPRNVATLDKYIELEDKLRNYAKMHRLDMSYLDTAIWIVMRVSHEEIAPCA